MQVPCGKCLDCLRKYQNALSNRMYEEFKSKGFKGVFFTLTYDDKHVPKNYLAQGLIYRSTPDYAYTNVTLDKTGREVVPFRTRRKYAEHPYAVLQRAGVLDAGAQETIEDFNKYSSSRKRSAWFSQMQDKFVKHLALTSPSVGEFRGPISESVPDIDSESYLSIEGMSFDDSDIWQIDEETGEMSLPVDNKTIEDDERLRQWYVENTPIVSFNSVRKEDVQLWLKRNRTIAKRRNSSFDFTYFITSEYGPRTLRPHYHGVLFGVTKDDVSEWFRDWQRHYGEIVVFDNLDPNKGGLSYVSKYCSKGFFEHPLCCKDFFYFYRKANNYKEVVCNEYHSHHFEKCIKWFGIDASIVDRTFHLFSKGLGVDWINHNNLRCSEFEDVARNYVPMFSSDSSTLLGDSVKLLGVSSDALLSGDFLMEDLIYKALNYEYQKSPDAWLRRFLLRAVFTRNFRYKDKQTGQFLEKCFAFQVPRYYREKMFGTNLRVAYPLFVRKEHERVYREEFEQLASSNLSRKDDEVASMLEQKRLQQIVDKFNNCFESQKKFLEKSRL